MRPASFALIAHHRRHSAGLDQSEGSRLRAISGKKRLAVDTQTRKPLALRERAIENSSKLGDLVTDRSLGSGSSLIACERSGRTCYGIELDVNYASIVLLRWEAFTDLEASRLE